jgi:hypothetical protein
MGVFHQREILKMHFERNFPLDRNEFRLQKRNSPLIRIQWKERIYLVFVLVVER